MSATEVPRLGCSENLVQPYLRTNSDTHSADAFSYSQRQFESVNGLPACAYPCTVSLPESNSATISFPATNPRLTKMRPLRSDARLDGVFALRDKIRIGQYARLILGRQDQKSQRGLRRGGSARVLSDQDHVGILRPKIAKYVDVHAFRTKYDVSVEHDRRGWQDVALDQQYVAEPRLPNGTYVEYSRVGRIQFA